MKVLEPGLQPAGWPEGPTARSAKDGPGGAVAWEPWPPPSALCRLLGAPEKHLWLPLTWLHWLEASRNARGQEHRGQAGL